MNDGAFRYDDCEQIVDPVDAASTICRRCQLPLALDDARWDAYDDEVEAAGKHPF